MYDFRKQPPFCPLNNQVKSPSAALTRMTVCCYKVKLYFTPLSIATHGKEYLENSIWLPRYSHCKFLQNSLKRNPDKSYYHLLPTLHLKISKDSREKVETETWAKWPLFLYVRGWSQVILDRMWYNWHLGLLLMFPVTYVLLLLNLPKWKLFPSLQFRVCILKI